MPNMLQAYVQMEQEEAHEAYMAEEVGMRPYDMQTMQ